MWIAEIGRATAECVGSHRRPDGIGQIHTGFHHDDQVASTGDVGPKLIHPHAETAIAGLHLRIPQCRWTTSKSRSPACGVRQVIDGRIVVTIENERTSTWGVSLKIDSPQTIAVRECRASNAGYGLGHRDTGQAGAGIERIIADAGDIIAHRDAGQFVAPLKRKVSYVGDAVANCDVGQILAVGKRPNPNAGEVVACRDAGQIGAGFEGRFSEACDTVGDRDAIYPRINNSTC